MSLLGATLRTQRSTKCSPASAAASAASGDASGTPPFADYGSGEPTAASHRAFTSATTAAAWPAWPPLDAPAKQ